MSSALHPHRLRNIILTVVITPLALMAALLIAGFVMNVFDRSERIRLGDYSLEQPASTVADYNGDQKKLIEGENNYSFGSENPQLTIVEFADFACPFCQASFPGLREISLKHQDKVKVIYRDWPGHSYSLPLALAAYCAGEQGKFWEMHDKLFQNQSDSFGSDKNQLALLAQQLGIYNEQFQTCFDSQKYLPQIRKNFQDSQTLGVRGTPTWFFNGQKIEGAMTAAQMESMVAKFIQ